MKKLSILPILLAIILFSNCKNTSSSDTKADNQIEQKLSDHYNFLSSYSANTQGEYDEQFSWNLDLWNKNDSIYGILKLSVYVTDFNFTEYQSFVSGIKTNSQFTFEGNFDTEPFNGQFTLDNENLTGNIEFPSNPNRSFKQLNLTTCCEESNSELQQLNSIKAIQDHYHSH